MRTTVGIKIGIDYTVYENNRLAWKPYFDYDSMTVAVGKRAYFIGGRQPAPLCYYDCGAGCWAQEGPIEGLKPFGESEGTVIGNN